MTVEKKELCLEGCLREEKLDKGKRGKSPEERAKLVMVENKAMLMKYNP